MNNIVWFGFAKEAILSLDPNQYGVYVIYNHLNECVYVGMGDIRTRLLCHIDGENPCILRRQSSRWYGEVLTQAEMVEREKFLIKTLAPTCNQRIG